MAFPSNTWASGLLGALGKSGDRAKRAAKQGFDIENPWYHGTRADIDQFDPELGDLGVHIGTLSQAANRLNDTSVHVPQIADFDLYGQDATMMPLVTSAQNPLQVRDVGEWKDSARTAEALFQTPQLSDEAADKIAEITRFMNSDEGIGPGQFGNVDEWLESPENREYLDDMREILQGEGYDSIRYWNEVETRPGQASEIAKLKALKAEDEVRDFKRQLLGERPQVPNSEAAVNMTEAEFNDLVKRYGDYQVRSKALFGPDEVSPEIMALREELAPERAQFDALKNRAQDIRRDMALRGETTDSLIVFDPDQLRSPQAEFMPEGQRNEDLPGLLQFAGAPGGRRGLSAPSLPTDPTDITGSLSEASEGLQSDPFAVPRYVGRGVEGFGRDLLGAVAGLATGDPETVQGITGDRFIQPSAGTEAIDQIIARAAQPLMGALEAGQEAAYPYVTQALETPVGGQEIGQSVSQGIGGLADAWNSMDPATQQRLSSGAHLGMTAMDMIPGPNPAEGLMGMVARQGGDVVDDPRYFTRVSERRAAEAGEITTPQMEIEQRPMEVPEISLVDLEGRPFVSGMSDRSAGGGVIRSIDGRELGSPVNLQGGQDFMFDQTEHPGLVWASDQGPVTDIMRRAQRLKEETGQDPLFLPWRMAPTGVDHATMSGDLLIGNAIDTLPKSRLKEADKAIRELTNKKTGQNVGIPDWPGMQNREEAMAAWANATGMQRKAIKDQVFDTMLRGETGLSQPMARAAVTDPSQLSAQDYGLQSVGLIDMAAGLSPTAHRTYGVGIPGQGVGRLKEDIRLTDLFPEIMLSGSPHRKAMMMDTSGVITPGLIDVLLGGSR